MKIKIVQEYNTAIDCRTMRRFLAGEIVAVPNDVPEKLAATMLEKGIAVAAKDEKAKPEKETKVVKPETKEDGKKEPVKKPEKESKKGKK